MLKISENLNKNQKITFFPNPKFLKIFFFAKKTNPFFLNKRTMQFDQSSQVQPNPEYKKS